MLKHFYCPNGVCKVYSGTIQPDPETTCTVCGTPLSFSSCFIEIPVVEQLKTVLSRKLNIKMLCHKL